MIAVRLILLNLCESNCLHAAKKEIIFFQSEKSITDHNCAKFKS